MKKTIVIAVLTFTGLAYFISCKKAPVSPLIGTWRKIVAADTFYLKATDNSTMLYGEALSNNTGFIELGLGNYTYTPNQFTFTVQTNPDSTITSACIGYPGTYSYVVSSTQLTVTLVTDTCQSSGTQLRSSIISGVWMLQ